MASQAFRRGVVFLALALIPCAARSDELDVPPPGAPAPKEDSLADLRRRLEALEKKSGPETPAEVDLSGAEVPYRSLDPARSTLARPWFENFELGGFGGVGFLATGKNGAHPNGGFLVVDSSLFIRAWAWEDISFLVDLQFTYAGGFYSTSVRTGEIYAEARDILKAWKPELLSVRLGRLLIPFGEEYTRFRAPDNPLITNSAGFPYGFDEGLLLFGRLGRLDWIAAVTDGASARSFDENWDKAVNLKLSTPLGSRGHLSASFMRTGKTADSAFIFAGGSVQPVGSGAMSSAGVSSSDEVEAWLYQVDAGYRLAERFGVNASFGQAYLDDRDSRFDRHLFWFAVEGLYHITPRVYAVARYSEIGTYNAEEGYLLTGGFSAIGDDLFGFDGRRLQRLTFGLGWKPVPRVILKAEIGCDRFEVIRGSTVRPEDDAGLIGGFELVVVF